MTTSWRSGALFARPLTLLVAATVSLVLSGALAAQSGELAIAVSSTTASSGGHGVAVDRTVGVDLEPVTLREALERLEQATGIPIAYSPSLVDQRATLVECRCKGVSLEKAIGLVLEGTGFELSVVSDQFVVRQRTLVPSTRPPPTLLAGWSPPSEVRRVSSGPAGLSAREVVVGVEPARQGQIVGTIVDGEGRPLAAVQLSVEGTGLGSLSDAEGSFTIGGVPAGTYTLAAQRIGYQQVRRTNVTVTSGGSVTVDLTMNVAFLALQGVVATGLIDPVEGARSPITVDRVTREQMPVTVAGSAVENLQGRVPGLRMNRLSGQPGEDVSVMLRTPTSVTQGGEPLVVVDGVILGSGSANVESMDIESIEVIKGAAAASLYGSRAAAGVISITTARGAGLDQGQTQFRARSEFGVVQAFTFDNLPTHHYFLMDPAGTTYVDLNGNPVSRNQRQALPPNRSFMDQPYPAGTRLYDPLGNVFSPGNFQTHTASVGQNTASTNFQMSLNRYREGGIVDTNDGYSRNSFRVNLDHRFLEGMALGVSVYHSRDHRDNMSASFADMLRAPRDLDLRVKDENGEFVRVPDPSIAFQNPLWTEASRENDRNRIRTLASGSFRWDPVYWVGFMGAVSYDREDESTRFYLPKGTPLSVTQEIPADGTLTLGSLGRDTWNAEAQITFRQDFGNLNARVTGRAIMEADRFQQSNLSGSDFIVSGVPRINNAATRTGTSSAEEVNSLGYLVDTALDYDGKYIFTALARRDGSSLFGADNRWHTYYRVAGAWRVAEEDWFDVANVSELKLSYARGTAGGRPQFNYQYETWNVTPAGVSMGILGNRELRPEHTTEQEVSVESIVFDRFGISLTHAWHNTSDQLDFRRVPAFTGFSNQWTNGGVMVGRTTEFTFEARLVATPRFGWTTIFIADRSTGEIQSWPQCRTVAFRLYCDGVENNTQWAGLFVKGFDYINPDGDARYHGPNGSHRGGNLWDHRDQFQVNDDGFLVWVGDANYWEGIEKNLWGTSRVIEGTRYNWGEPMQMLDGAGTRQRAVIGQMPTSSIGWLNNFNFGQFRVHAHLNAVFSGTAYDSANRELALTRDAPFMDQGDKRDELKKPLSYYQALTPFGSSFVFDGAFIKLRALQVAYPLSSAQVQRFGLGRLGISAAEVGVVGRNLLTITSFPGTDPEIGDLNTRLASTGGGIATYPRTRTFTMEASVTF